MECLAAVYLHEATRFHREVDISGFPDEILKMVEGLNNTATIYSRPNEQNYWVPTTDVIEGVGGAFSTMKYAEGNYSAAVAYSGSNYRVLAFGFPLDCITDAETRRSITGIAIDYLLGK